MKLYEAGIEKQRPGVVLADVLRQTGGAYETTTPLTEKFRDHIREVAELTSDDELLRIAELPEVPARRARPQAPGSDRGERLLLLLRGAHQRCQARPRQLRLGSSGSGRRPLHGRGAR